MMGATAEPRSEDLRRQLVHLLRRGGDARGVALEVEVGQRHAAVDEATLLALRRELVDRRHRAALVDAGLRRGRRLDWGGNDHRGPIVTGGIVPGWVSDRATGGADRENDQGAEASA